MTRVMRLLAAFGLAVFATNARAEDKNPAEKPFDDAEFVKMAASGGMHEVELGKIAQAKSTNADVKKFGERLVTDHTKANADLKAAAKAAGIVCPETMTEHHQKEVNRFKEFKGSDFDAQFAQHEVKDHEHDIAMFTRASKEAKNPAIKDFATKSLPVLKEHLEMAKKLQTKPANP